MNYTICATLLRRLAIVIAATMAVLALSWSADARALATIDLSSGQSTTLAAPGLNRVAVGDARIAGVVALGTSQVVVNGKAPGRTTLFVWDAGGRHDYEVVVTEQQAGDLAQMLRSAINEPNVAVTAFGHDVVVRGTVADQARFARLSDLLSRFDVYAKNAKAAIVNAVSVEQPLGPLQAQLSSVAGASGLRVDADPKGNLIVSGAVPDRWTAEAVLARVRGLAGPYLGADAKVIDRLAVAQISQIDTKVQVLEVDDTGLRQLGVRLQSAVPAQNAAGYTLNDPNFPIVERAVEVGKALTSGGFFRNITLAPTVDLLIRTGHARELSAPSLVTLPGNQATFLVGGEVPIIYSTGLGAVSVIFKEYGVKLQITPNLMAGGGVETKIAPEVSDLDFQDGVSYNGFVIPAFKTSKLATDIVTKPGESIVMGGLMRRVEQRFVDKVPGLGDLPVLGKLFRSTRYQNQQTDVVFVMTPHVVTR